MEKEKKYFIISSIVIIALAVFSILNVDSVMEATLDGLSKLPISLNQSIIDSLHRKAFYIVPNIFSIIMACIILIISFTNRISTCKKLMISFGIFLLICSSTTIASILSIINIIISANMKGVSSEKKGIPELERYTDGTDGIRIAAACMGIYLLYMLFVSANGYISQIICSFIILTIIVLLFWKNLWRDFVIFFKSIKEYILFVLPKIGLMYVIYFIVSFLCFFINKDISVNQQHLNALPGWYVLILASTFAPIVEEIIFRGCIRRLIKNDTLFIIVSGVIFGLLHTMYEQNILISLFMALPYITLGCGFAYIYAKTNNITNNILCHAVHNFIISLMHM